MKHFQYYLPTRIVFGSDTLNLLPEKLKEYFSAKTRILLVTGTGSLKESGITDKILKLLSDFTVVLFDKVSANPTSDMVNAGIEKFEEHSCELIIAVGGGSVIDTGKAIATLLTNEGTLEDYQKGKNPVNEAKDLIAIPTTSGTSSEMTIWSVITNFEGHYKHQKKSFSGEKMYPKLAIIDPVLTLTLDKKQTASTGLDALSHAIEGYWSKKTNPLSNVYCLEAIKLILKYLPKAFENGSDLEAREKVSFAAMLAGLAFSNSRTTSPHKISYPLTTNYNLPHGAACILTLPYFMEYIGDNDAQHLEEIVKVLKCKDYKEAADLIKDFVKQLDMPNKLSDLGMSREEIPYIAKTTYVEIEKQEDPVPISYEDYLKILEKAF